jgi:ABC-type branched-subunit amino acid transport system ATPase component
MSASLHIEALESGYHGKNILHGISLSIPAGGALTVLGPNGSGKSTFLKTVVGLVPAQRGSISLAGTDITQLDAPGRARQGVATVLQEANVFRNMSVLENLRTGWEYLTRERTRHALQERMEQVLTLFPEIRPHLRRAAGLLSGGQRQMVAIASALMQSPSLLVLDEPSAGLSPRNASLLYEGVRRVRDTGVTLLLIEQNVPLGLSVADTGLILVAGQIRHQAPAQALAQDPDLHHYFLGTRA